MGTHGCIILQDTPSHGEVTEACGYLEARASHCIDADPNPVSRQVEVFVMSKSGFAFSAAYSTVPVRGVWMQRDVDACTWSNYNDHCLMRACPGQVKGHSWTLIYPS